MFERSPVERLGYKGGANPNIRDHKFFERIDWTKLEQRRVNPPFKPLVVSELYRKRTLTEELKGTF